MNSEDYHITLPKRKNTPTTQIFIQIMCENKMGDRDTILLIPGGPGGNHTVYNGIKKNLYAYADLVLIDPRGCGKSLPADVEDCNLEKNIEDIEAIRTVLDLEKIILLGGSYGSMVALGYAISFSERLNQLILLAGAPDHGFLITAKKNLLKIATAVQQEWAERLWTGNFKSSEELDEFYKVMSPLYSHFLKNNFKFSPPNTQEKIPYNFKLTNHAYQKNFYCFDFRNALSQIECPTLIIAGDTDWINDPIHTKEMAEKIPQAKLCLLKKCGHYLWLDQPEQFYDCIKHHIFTSKKVSSMKLS
jgi:proline iminopeptidase